MSQPSSQDSIETQEIYSQGSFDEIWQTLGRTFSSMEKMLQGVLIEEIPTVIEYKDEQELEKFEITYRQRTFRNSCQPSSQPVVDLDLQLNSQPQITTVTNGVQNVQLPLINEKSPHPFLLSPMSPMSPIDPIQLPFILPNTNYPGKYNFSICFEPNSGPITKATPRVYQEESHKLFVKMQCVCPILFKIHGTPPPGSLVRGILTYKMPENYKDVVIRCPNHKNTCKDGHPFQNHVMRCENSVARYESCPNTDRLSLVIPLKATDVVVDEGYFKELFKFTCFNSCVGGMNRRPTNLLFRLECGNEIFARSLVEVRICASPGRDCTEKDSAGAQKTASKDQDKRNGNEHSSTTDAVLPWPLSPAVPSCNPTSPTTTNPQRCTVLMSTRKDNSCSVPESYYPPNVHVVQKKRPCVATNGVVLTKAKRTCLADPTDDEIFVLRIKGRERYEMLLKIKEGLDVLDGILPAERNPCRSDQTENARSPEFTRIKPKSQLVQVKREGAANAECNSQPNTSPPSSQENPTPNLSQLSRTSSNASSQSSTTRAIEEYSAWQVILKRTLSVENPSISRSGCM